MKDLLVALVLGGVVFLYIGGLMTVFRDFGPLAIMAAIGLILLFRGRGTV